MTQSNPDHPRSSGEDSVVPTIACPQCGEHKSRPSMKTGIVEYVGAWFGLRAYRCRGCRHRFYRWGPPPAEVEVLGANEAEPLDEQADPRER